MKLPRRALLAVAAPPPLLLASFAIDTAAIGGGWSGLHLDADLRATAVSDLGRWLTARLDPAHGLVDIRTSALRDAQGRPLTTRAGRDAEAITRSVDGTWLVAFERDHRLAAYTDLDGPARLVAAPPGLDAAPANAGLEALTLLADGRLLALAEGLADAPNTRRGWIGAPGAWASLAYRAAPGLDPVDAAGLPDGGALVLERGFSWLGGFRGRLTRLPASALRAGAVLEPEPLLDLVPPLPVENFEAVAVAPYQGRLLVALLSDDNASRWQQTLLLLFELRD